jgi:hypothetical protein
MGKQAGSKAAPKTIEQEVFISYSTRTRRPQSELMEEPLT